ncbi:hypothetical protein [Polymorphobacter sp.]|uniref:hypothetical protein n=1 Tax=Polymorphobacter sp. TaxID=1909290 RepID=UPI003F7275DF
MSDAPPRRAPSSTSSTATLRADGWHRFRRLLAWSAGIGLAAGIGAILWLIANGTRMSLHLALALGGGIFLSLLLAGALMGLLFVSNRIGHDQEARDQSLEDNQ